MKKLLSLFLASLLLVGGCSKSPENTAGGGVFGRFAAAGQQQKGDKEKGQELFHGEGADTGGEGRR